MSTRTPRLALAVLDRWAMVPVDLRRAASADAARIDGSPGNLGAHCRCRAGLSCTTLARRIGQTRSVVRGKSTRKCEKLPISCCFRFLSLVNMRYAAACKRVADRARPNVSGAWRSWRGDAIAILSASLRDERRAGDRWGDSGQLKLPVRCFDRCRWRTRTRETAGASRRRVVEGPAEEFEGASCTS